MITDAKKPKTHTREKKEGAEDDWRGDRDGYTVRTEGEGRV